MNRSGPLVVACACALQLGCGGQMTTSRISSSPEVLRATVTAVESEETGPDAETIALANTLWVESVVAREVGDAVAVRRVLMRLLRTAPNTRHEPDARIFLADDALARGDWSRARALVEPLEATGALAYQRFRVMALAHEGQTDYARAAQAWLSASEQADDDASRRRAVSGAVQDLYLDGKLEGARKMAESVEPPIDDVRKQVASRLEPGILESLAESVSETDPDHHWLALGLAQARCAGGQLRPCQEAARAASTSLDPHIAELAGKLLERVTAWNEVNPARLGVLLPLSGRFREYGETALESIQQALDGAPHVQLVVRDTAGKAGQAARGAEELILDEHVAAILGPIGEMEGQAAVISAARFRVPHVVLSSKPGLCESVPTAFRMRLSPGEKVKALARYAVTELGVRRAAFLVPEQESRRRQMMAFWDEFVRLGGEVRAVQTYPSTEQDFKSVISKLLGSRKPGKGTVDFDALFIPDDALHVQRLVPFLKYFGMRMKTHPKLRSRARNPSVQLLGVEAWHSAVVIDGEGLTDNAVFADTFFHDPDNRIVDRFVRRFYARHRRKPRAFQAEVFDTMSLLVAAMKGREGKDQTVREAIHTALLATKHHEGVTGHMTVLDDGKLVLQPRLLTVHLDEIRLRLSEEEEAHVRRRSGRSR